MTRSNDSLEIGWSSGHCSHLPYLWLRDNCNCDDCRVVQTSEKKFMLADVRADLEPAEINVVDDCLYLVWPDGHKTSFLGETLRANRNGRELAWSRWPSHFTPERVPCRAFLESDRVAAAAIAEFVDKGVFILCEAPDVPGSLEEFAPRLGPVRELLFDRIHNVEVDADGYNVAHTALPLPPHNDFASYAWPPSVQALHMLANDTPGGDSIVVDGWAILGELRDDHPDFFESLCRMPVPFREFDDHNETYAVAPIVRCDVDGNIVGIRFSNQLMQTIDPTHPDTLRFYRAYHELCRRISDERAHVAFRLHSREILVVAAHRVLHGRESFEPIGRRHLQDAYFEFDNVRNHLYVLRRKGVR